MGPVEEIPLATHTDQNTIAEADRPTAQDLFPEVYDRLRSLAETYLRRERIDHTLQPTAIVHEVYLRLVGQSRAQWRDAEHFFLVAAEAARRVLIDHARGRLAAKRGGRRQRLGEECLNGLTDDRPWTELVALDDAMDRLWIINRRLGRVAVLHLYAGMNHDQVATTLGLGRSTIANEWAAARAWLTRDLKGDAHVGH